ncbi:hypothetical protein SAMN05444166_5277 [Singulisphaera sp. GP187]|uniref:hypothetical protein n=1 Tax=Singulisphaera sp. GP187 TaxID=1882752 RepID=UPI000927398E|nr:hypothetical protein [Singulisphaera sp. GP187]SIO56679.1 hypothetical protein SAMN05444166_5277 [Singulisphaera sp. GP187]
MRPWIRRASVRLFASLTLLGLMGCGSKNVDFTPDQVEESRLREVSQVLREYQLFNPKPPKSVKDIQASAGSSPGGFELIKSGEVVVCWGASLPDTKEEPGSGDSKEVLAYLKKVPQEGGLVLMLDRTVRNMTAEEFKAAPQAGTLAPAK